MASSLGEAILHLVSDATKLDKGLTDAKGKVAGAMDWMHTKSVAMGSMLGQLGAQAVTAIGSQIVAAGKESLNKFLEYATQIQQLQRVLGTNVDEAARLIQVADDVGIAYEAMTQAMAIASKNGIEVNIEGLKQLSDQYLSFAPGVERAEFAASKFGRGWAAMIPILEKGGEGIEKINDGIDEGLIPTEEAIKQAQAYKIAVDELSEVWDVFVYRVAPPVLNTLTDIINRMRDEVEATKLAAADGKTLFLLTGAQYEAYVAQAAAARETADATKALTIANKDATGSYEEAVDPMKAVAEELKRISDANRETMSFVLSYADFQKGYEEDHKKALEQQRDAQRELNDAIKEYGSGSEDAIERAQKVTFAQHDLNDAIKKYGQGSDEAAKARIKLNDAMDATSAGDDKISDATEKLNEANTAIGKLEASWHEKTQRMIYDMILTKLSVDGFTDAEFAAAQQLGVDMGIYTQAEADHALAMLAVANAYVIQIGQQEALTVAVDKTAEAYQNMAGIANSLGEVNYASGIGQRDSGGPGKAGTPYLIGTGAQPELFIPSTDGMFMPNGDYQAMMKSAFADLGNISGIGFTQGFAESMTPLNNVMGGGMSQTNSRSMSNTVNVYNPTAEPASRSVDSTLRKMAYLRIVK